MNIPPRLHVFGFLMLLSMFFLFACGGSVDMVLMDFEDGDYGDWAATGSSFGAAPANGSLENQPPVTGFKGKGFANSFHGGEESQGGLTSPDFEIRQPFINFLIGGATRRDETCMNLIVNGEIVRTATGRSSRFLDWTHWDVSDLEGKTARIEIVDRHPGRRGYILVDHIVQSSRAYVLADLTREIQVENKYLNLPVKTGVNNRRMIVEVSGEPANVFDIELAEGEPDFWAFMDLSRYLGKKAVIRVTQPWDSDPDVLGRLTQSDEIMNADTLYREKYRPQFHFTSRRGWNNDPNGLVFYDGEYHLFYQHNPYGWNWGNMHWGHAVSSDLIHWEELGDAIFPDELGTIFSGSAAVDWQDSAGFQAGDEKTIVCFYTSAGDQVEPQVPFTQSIAYSTDRGRTFTKYAGNPVIGHIIDANRDPKVIWEEPSQQWIMSLYLTRNDYTLLTSTDLKQWKRIGDVTIPGCSECPDIFLLSVDGDPDKTKWVFWGANGSYVLGTFDGTGFQPEGEAIRLYAGGSAYAAQSFSDIPESDGRRIQIPWLRCTMPGMPFNQQMGFPVELTLRTTDEGIRMFSEPVKEIENIHKNQHSWESLQIRPGENPLGSISGDLFDIRADISVGNSEEFGFIIRGIPVVYNSVEQTLTCRNVTTPMKPLGGGIRLQILVDRASIEIFGNNGRVYMPIGVIPPDDDTSLEFFTKGAAVRVNKLDVFELESIW